MKIYEIFKEDKNGKFVDVDWDKLETIPEFAALHGTLQNTDWHQEGDAYEHTRKVAENMKAILERENVTEPDVYQLLMAAAVFHDIGKPVTTYFNEQTQQYATEDHATAGALITRSIFFDEYIIGREELVYMVQNHMKFHYIMSDKPKYVKKLIKLSYGFVSIKYMLMLNEADSFGSVSVLETTEGILRRINMMRNIAINHNCLYQPYVFHDYVTARKELNNISCKDEVAVNSFTVHIMCGIPGAGKSTYIKNDPILCDLPVVSRDIIRYELGFTKSVDEKAICSWENEAKVSQIIKERIKNYCKAGQSFVVDNMNLKASYRQDIIKQVIPFGAQIHIIYVEAPSIETCINRRNGQIPAREYTRIIKSLSFPMLFECDKLTIFKDYEEGWQKHVSFYRPLYETDQAFSIRTPYKSELLYK